MARSPDFMTRPRSYYLGALVLILFGVVVGLGLSAGLDLPHAPRAERGVLAALTPGGDVPESPFVSVVQRALPAVVFVDVRKRTTGGDSDDPQDELFRRFFGEGRRPRTLPTSGSGFIIDREGRILTNNHVVRDANEINVTLNDKRTFKAKVVGTDPETDVAVIQIEGEDLPVLPLGDSDKIQVGDWAIAMGNPLGELRGSVTVGIISARGRSNLNIWGGTPSYQDFIQTDASINFGNSGGPLCNIRGEAIGINTAINPSGQGIGFAIPINLVKHVADQLVAHGEVKRAWLGVQLAELTPELAEGFGIRGDGGVVIQEVIKDQPAERAGLRRNDVIVEFEGKPVADVQKFRLKVADMPIGQKVALVVLRDGKRVPLTLTLGSRPEAQLAQNDNAPGGEEPASQKLAGVRVRELTGSERTTLKIDGGVMITDVESGSAAEDAGLEANDVVEEVNQKPVRSVSAFAEQIASAKRAGKKHAVLLVRRGNGTSYVPVRLSD
ncbi:MAG TPA: Do family serine endopeptidase [Candidatus Eisenbacteria bacterium]|jgi:Do/DeqQ family serine protease